MTSRIIFITLLAIAIATSTSDSAAQNFYKQQQGTIQSRKELNKDRNSFNKTRVAKENEKRAERDEKQGWKVNGGNPSLAYQYQVVDDYSTYRDDDGNDIFKLGSGSGTDKVRIKAGKKAQIDALTKLAAQIQIQLADLTKAVLVDDLELDEATKTLTNQVLNKCTIIMDKYIRNDDGTYIVEQTWALDLRELRKMEEEQRRQEAKESLKALQDELDAISDF